MLQYLFCYLLVLVELAKAYEEVAQKKHRIRLDALEAFALYYLGCSCGLWFTTFASAKIPIIFRQPPIVRNPWQVDENGEMLSLSRFAGIGVVI